MCFLSISRDGGPRRRSWRCPSALPAKNPWFTAGLAVCLVSTGAVSVSEPALCLCGPAGTCVLDRVCWPFLCLRHRWRIAFSPRRRPPPHSLQLLSLALLQLLRRSAADIVRENTNREMATFLMDSIILPDPHVQALFSELDSSIFAIVRAHGRNCG